MTRCRWLNILLFTLFSIMQLAQIVCFPREALLMLHDPTQSLFIGSIPMGFATIVNGIVFFCVPRYGSAAVDVAWVTFWIDTGLSLISGWLVRSLCPFLSPLQLWDSVKLSWGTVACCHMCCIGRLHSALLSRPCWPGNIAAALLAVTATLYQTLRPTSKLEGHAAE